MEELAIPVNELIQKLKTENPTAVLSEEDIRKAEQDINKKMEIFSIEQRSYFNKSIESASRAYLTF